MPRHTSAAEPAPAVRIVIVTMDNHLASATDRARATLAAQVPGLSLRMHTAAEWDSDPAALERCRADIARGDIIVSTMLFMDDHIQAVLPALQARRAHCDAMVCCMSGAEVTQAHAHGPLRHGCQAQRRAGLPQAPARQAQGRRRFGQRRAADAHAAAAAEDPALHPRHRAGRAGLLPDPAVLALRLGRERGQHGAHAGRPLRRRRAPRPARHARAPAAGRVPRGRRVPPAACTAASPSPPTACRAGARAARSACC